MRVQYSRWGLKHDYRGAIVSYRIGGRDILGTVCGVYREDVLGVTFFKVRHFNGEDAPDIATAAVEILERES